MLDIAVENDQTRIIHDEAIRQSSSSTAQLELGNRSRLVVAGVDLTIASAHLQPFSKSTITLTNGACVVLDCAFSQDSASGVLMEIEDDATLVLKRAEALSHFSAIAFIGARRGTLRIGAGFDQRVVEAPPVFGFAAGDRIDWITAAPVGQVSYQPNTTNSGGSLRLYGEAGALLGRVILVGEYEAADFDVHSHDRFCQLRLATAGAGRKATPGDVGAISP